MGFLCLRLLFSAKFALAEEVQDLENALANFKNRRDILARVFIIRETLGGIILYVWRSLSQTSYGTSRKQ